MIGHLGARVSALLDGQLSAGESEEAWRHVYGCHACRDLVEREGWVKSRLAGLAQAPEHCSPVPNGLKGSLLNLTPGDPCLLAPHSRGGARRAVGFGAAFVGGGAVGAALLGVVALGIAPGSGTGEIRPPVSQVGNVVPTGPGAPASSGAATATPASGARTRRHPRPGAGTATAGLTQVLGSALR